jgi:hypothetical protein
MRPRGKVSPTQVKDIWDIFGGILLVAIVAVILTKKNTATDISATGKAFTVALSTAEAG